MQYVPVEIETVKREYIDRVHKDSIHVLDSIYIREKGDTVWLTRWRTEYRDKIIRDSIIVNDTIRIPVPVERKLNRWEKTKMDLGGIAIGGIISIVIMLVFYIVFRRIKR